MAGATIALQLPRALFASFDDKKRPVKIGLIADLHQDLIHNGQERLNAFVQHMKAVQPDALIQMGDFAYPSEKNRAVIDMFNHAHDIPMHVIGNHDTDAGHTKQQCLEIWGMPQPYYSREIKGVHFIFLDGNEKGSPAHKGGYPAFIGNEQMAWLKMELAHSQKPVVVVSHQPLAGWAAVDNAEAVQDLLAAYKKKIVLAINGHTHIDALYTVKDVHYAHINSASYFWMGSPYKHTSYSKAVHDSYPWLSSTCPYKDALFTVLTIEPQTGLVKIEGRNSEWVGASPAALHYQNDAIGAGKEIVPFIRGRKINL